MDNQTDTKTITIEIRENANVTILNLDHPSFAYIGDNFDVTYDIENSGGEQMCYAKISDNNGNELDRWEGTVGSGATQSIAHTLNFDTSGNISLVIEAGYIK